MNPFAYLGANGQPPSQPQSQPQSQHPLPPPHHQQPQPQSQPQIQQHQHQSQPLPSSAPYPFPLSSSSSYAYPPHPQPQPGPSFPPSSSSSFPSSSSHSFYQQPQVPAWLERAFVQPEDLYTLPPTSHQPLYQSQSQSQSPPLPPSLPQAQAEAFRDSQYHYPPPQSQPLHMYQAQLPHPEPQPLPQPQPRPQSHSQPPPHHQNQTPSHPRPSLSLAPPQSSPQQTNTSPRPPLPPPPAAQAYPQPQPPQSHTQSLAQPPAPPQSPAQPQSSLDLNTSYQPFPSPYDDPAKLLRVYPFATYTPTARVASHFSPNTVTYPTPSSSDSLYPQHAAVFQQMDNPQTPQDAAARHTAEDQVHRMLLNHTTSYVNQPYTPQTSGAPQTPGQTALPYSFLPAYLPSPSAFREPPTPASIVSSSPAAHSSNYFERYITDTLNRRSASPTASSTAATPTPSTVNPAAIFGQPSPASSSHTPTLARKAAAVQLTPGESPDPLSFTGPSPSKKPKSIPNHQSSPTRDAGSAHATMSSSLSAIPTSSLPPLTSSSSVPKKRNLKVEVVIPLRPSPSPSKASDVSSEVGTPSSRHRQSSTVESADDESEEDELDWGAREDGDGDWVMSQSVGMKSPSPGPYGGATAVAQGSGRTGERDMRTSFQKLENLMEDVFEESDSFEASPSPDDVARSKYFSTLAKDDTTPLLSVPAIDKLTRYISRVHTTKRRQRPADSETITWDTEAVGRLIKLLERCMIDADAVVPFPNDGRALAAVKKDKKKKKRGTPKSDGEEEMREEIGERSPEIDEDGISEEIREKGERGLRIVGLGGAAAMCCLVLLDGDGVPKQLYSEDLLSRSVAIIKDQMSQIIFPVVEGLAGEKVSSHFLAYILQIESETTSKSKKLSPFFKHPLLSLIAQTTSAAVPHIASLIRHPDMTFSDGLVIQAVYLAIGPIFVAEPATVGKRAKKDGVGAGAGRGPTMAVMKSLRMEALGCLRGAFARYESQRQWIIEEILGSLVKVTDQSNAQTRFQLANGTSIHTISALLLQIIQASTHGTAARIRKLRASALEMEILGSTGDKLDVAEEEARICADTIESALRSTSVIGMYLLQKSGSSKSTKTTHETDYKAILETFVSDLLNVLYRPEWPAASLHLSILSKLMMNILDEPKGSNESSAGRHVALDQLGDIAARLRAMHLEMNAGKTVPSLDEVVANANVDGCQTLIKAQTTIKHYLSLAARDDGMYESSSDLNKIVWAQEIQNALRKVTSVIEKLAAETKTSEEAALTREKLQNIAQQLRTALRDVWAIEDSLFEINDVTQSGEAAQASIAVSRCRPLQGAFEPILHHLVTAMDTSVVLTRQKALRGLSGIVTADPDVLEMPAVRTAIEDRLSDSSPAVRDAAVELIGKYVVQRSNIITQYYPHIAMRVTDTGLGVRKRVIKLLRGIFAITESHKIKVDICGKLVVMTGDEDDAVQELAAKGLSEILYPSASSEANESAALLVDMIGEYSGSLSSLETALQAVGKECESSGHRDKFAQTVDALITRLIDATEQTEFDTLSHIRAISLLTAGQPNLIDTAKAVVLLTYLRPPNNADEQAANDMLLRIFRQSIPFMPRAASTFAQDLTKVLTPMIGKPAGGFHGLKETIGCYCAVIKHLTRDYVRLISVLRSCENKLRGLKRDMKTQGPAVAAAQPSAMVMYIAALIAEHCDLDAVAAGDKTVKAELNKIVSGRPVSEYLFDLFLDFARVPATGSAPGVCLGSMFRAYPVLAIRDETLEWMRIVFTIGDSEDRARLLDVIHGFLVSEAEKKNSRNEEKDVKALIGDAAQLKESGVSTALVQANIEHVLEGAKSSHPSLQAAAMDVLAFTVKQGLYHPLLCLPILISLETSDDQHVSDRALSLHATIHSKHSTLVNVRYLDFARASYDYQRTMTGEVSGQRRGDARLAGWYGLISEKRAWRLEFLRALSKAFEFDLGRAEPIDPGFALYIAENLASFEYKLQDEAMAVVQHLSQVVSGGVGVANVLETIQLHGAPNEEIAGKVVNASETEQVAAEQLINASIIIGLALMTKNHLLDAYSLSEEKCLKLVPGKKSAQGDKPATRKSPAITALDLDRMPLVRGVVTVEEFESQQATILQLLREDGSLDLIH